IRFSCEAMFATAEDYRGKQRGGTAAPPDPGSGEGAPAGGDRAQGRRLARSTAFFSFATGLSRLLGLVREGVAASVFVIIGALVGLVPVLPAGKQIYAYAIGVLAGTVVQFLLPLPWLRGRGGRFTFTLDWKNPRVLKVLKLMLPVTLALGLINLSLLIN